ncbi:MAG: hybrid sensor histidine kinase/response regulator [Spartobacteria bacterium]|nr:hybrid sensor histidine kinase/response regulator [Spartobacteria bacterium]
MSDNLMQEFIAESRDHLATIEADLLAIEDAGDQLDDELINKVFRAAHSIKGGSGFFGLVNIKELAHKAETVLDMMRSRKIMPNPEVINILLQSFDVLRDMINDVGESESYDISDQLVSLNGLTSSYLPPSEKQVLSQDVIFTIGTREIRIPRIDVTQCKKRAQYIYSIDYDLLHDIEFKGQTPWDVIKRLTASGEMLDASIDFEAVGTLDGPGTNVIPFNVIHATVAEPDMAEPLYGVPGDRVHVLANPNEPSTGTVVNCEVFNSGMMKPVTAAVDAAPAVPPVPAPPVAAPPVAVQPVEKQPVSGESAMDDLPLLNMEMDTPETGLATLPKSKKSGSDRKITKNADTSLRVNVSLLESLMNLAGELVLSRNQLREAVSRSDERSIVVSSQRISLVTSELQETIMQTRMQPVGSIFAKFPRLVRDLARDLEKDIVLNIDGKEVELDKTLIEGLSDPLTHMVRNAVDHGIEKPADRVRAGKKAQGTVHLQAYHEAGLVIIELQDDGKGIDAERVALSAVKKGLITQEKMRNMSDKEKFRLIFLPGLSTAEKVTDVSGRGVGMDVVQSNIERLGGKVEIDSMPGKGSVFRIKMPLTLAIIPSLIVDANGQRFAIPQVNVAELLHIHAEDIHSRIDVVGDAEVLLLREQLVPIVRFNSVFAANSSISDWRHEKPDSDRKDALGGRVKRKSGAGGRGTADHAVNIVVVSTGAMQYGLIVDTFQNTEEIVVKPLGQHLKNLQEYAGATIMGDGKVALILDVTGLAAKAELASVVASTPKMTTTQDHDAEQRTDVHSLMMFYNSPGEACALPLESVQRLERISPKQVEKVGGRHTMQYRGEALPLVMLADTADVPLIEMNNDLIVVVTKVYGRDVGLLGCMPVDVVETDIHIDKETLRQKGIAGSCIIKDSTVLMIDIFELVEKTHPEWVRKKDIAAKTRDGDPSVLLAEDSDFFRSQEKKIIENAGFNVLEAPDGEEAWEVLLKNPDAVQVVVTDIEMPRLNGLGLAQRIRADARFSHLPIIGVTSLAGDEDMAKGKAAGIDDYQVKLDQERLIAKLREMVRG